MSFKLLLLAPDLDPSWPDNASGCEAPESDQQFSSQRHDHGCLACALGAGCAFYVPLGQGATLLENEESPRELDQTPSHSAVA